MSCSFYINLKFSSCSLLLSMPPKKPRVFSLSAHQAATSFVWWRCSCLDDEHVITNKMLTHLIFYPWLFLPIQSTASLLFVGGCAMVPLACLDKQSKPASFLCLPDTSGWRARTHQLPTSILSKSQRISLFHLHIMLLSWCWQPWPSNNFLFIKNIPPSWAYVLNIDNSCDVCTQHIKFNRREPLNRTHQGATIKIERATSRKCNLLTSKTWWRDFLYHDSFVMAAVQLDSSSKNHKIALYRWRDDYLIISDQRQHVKLMATLFLQQEVKCLH